MVHGLLFHLALITLNRRSLFYNEFDPGPFLNYITEWRGMQLAPPPGIGFAHLVELILPPAN